MKKVIIQLLEKGFDVLLNKIPVKVKGDILYFIDKVDEEDNKLLVLRDLLTYSEDELKQILGANFYKDVIEYY